MKITWLGHSCFKIESEGYAIVLDPYDDGYVDGLGPLRTEADEVLCSHDHGDHNAVHVVTRRKGGVSPFRVGTIAAWHDDVRGAKRGPDTIHILDDGVCRVAHLGDLGCPLTEEQIRILSYADALLVPIGGFFTIDAKQAKAIVEQIRPTVTIPMHYRGASFGFQVLGTLDAFTALCDDVVEYEGNSLELTKETPRQTAVLKLQNEGEPQG